jgi:hypothetical protein
MQASGTIMHGHAAASSGRARNRLVLQMVIIDLHI